MEMATKILKDYNFDPNCFNYNTLLNRKLDSGEVEVVSLKDIMISDMVETNLGLFEPVLTSSNHRDSLFVLNKLIIDYEGNQFTLELTGNHLLIVLRKGSEIVVASKDVDLSDKIEVVINRERKLGTIIEIKHIISRNVINIRTPSRRLITNNVITTCDIEEDLGDFGGFVLTTAAKINKNLPQKLNQFALKVYGNLRNLTN